MKSVIIVILTCINLSSSNMGMNYFIEANVETPCMESFPDGLSYFFEQYGGYDEKSMVSQVEKALNIDLHIFQEYDFPENEEPEEKYWKNISEFELVINEFIGKINKDPGYYMKIKYNPVKAEFSFSTDPEEMKRMQEQMKEHEEHPMYGYPIDTGYLSSKAILKDLETLKKLLECYKIHGATKAKLTYI